MAFVFNSVLLGIGLEMDAFSVSVANGLRDPHMPMSGQLRIAGVFAFFQYLMPVLGWLGIHGVVSAFSAFERMVPWIALILLAFIGEKMILEAVRGEEEAAEAVGLTWPALLMQGVATSIDALSAGFALESYSFPLTLLSGAIIALVTLLLCLVGVKAGQKAGQYLTRWSSVLAALS